MTGNAEGAYMQPIPGPDPGACPDCGSWKKAGMLHECLIEQPETYHHLTQEQYFRRVDDRMRALLSEGERG